MEMDVPRPRPSGHAEQSVRGDDIPDFDVGCGGVEVLDHRPVTQLNRDGSPIAAASPHDDTVNASLEVHRSGGLVGAEREVISTPL